MQLIFDASRGRLKKTQILMVLPFVSLRLYRLFDFSPLPVELFLSFGKKLHSSNENIYRYGCGRVTRKIISLGRSAGNIFSFWPQGKTFREFFNHCCVLFLNLRGLFILFEEPAFPCSSIFIPISSRTFSHSFARNVCFDNIRFRIINFARG